MEPVTWATGFGALLASCAFLVYHNREVSYSSLLDLSITARQQRLYDEKGLDIEKWTEMGEHTFFLSRHDDLSSPYTLILVYSYTRGTLG